VSRALRIKAVLFDVDGTLVDSNDFHAEAWHKAIARFGFDIPVARIRGQIGKGADNLLPALLPADFLEARQAELERYRGELFTRDYLGRIEPFAGVCALFERVASANIRIVLASSGTDDEVSHHLDLIGCRDLVESRTTRDDAARSKPCPDIFQAALATLDGVAPAEAVMVGDSPYDMIAAGKIGLARIGLLCGGFPAVQLRETGADELYDSPCDLLARFDSSLLMA